MTDSESLLQQISSGEGSFLELKEIMLTGSSVAGPHRNGMADEMAAMANSNSGTILLGVNDKTRAITGIPDQALDLVETWVRNIVNDLIKPPLICQIKKVRLDLEAGSCNLIKVSIPRSLFVHQSPGGSTARFSRHVALSSAT